MEELISKMSQLNDLQSTMKRWCVENSLERPRILNYPLEKISKLYDNFLEKYGSSKKFSDEHENSAQPIWFENQLNLFRWAVIALSFTRQTHLTDFVVFLQLQKNQQIHFLSEIFRQKQKYIIEYEIKCLQVKGKQIRNGWKAEEEQILSTVIQKSADKNKWNQIARQLFKVSQGKYFRQGKHCRQRWFSYMGNQKSGKQWNLETDIELLQLISARGKRWDQLANKFKKHQRKLTLRRRFKLLLQEAYAELGHYATQKEAISFLLQQKYEKASISTNKVQPKRVKRICQPNENRNSAKMLQKSSKQKEFSPESDEQWSGSKESKLKFEDQSQEKLKVVMEDFMPYVPVQMGQNISESEPLVFSNGIQNAGNICNMGCFPVQYYQQFYTIVPPIGLDGVNYGSQNSPHPLGNQILFYL